MAQASTAEQVHESRRYPRLPCEIEVNLSSDHNFYTGFTSNISEGGLFVATEALCDVGTELEFEFALTGDPPPMKVRGIVRWVRESNDFTSDVPAGMGIEFTGLDDDAQARINAFIKTQRESIFFV